MINNSNDVLRYIIKQTTTHELEDIEEYLKRISFLDDLFPCLARNRVINVFYHFLVKNNLTYLLDKTSYRLINQVVTFSSLKVQEYEDLFKIIKKGLNESEIPYVVLKGFHLNNALYENPYGFILRDYNDIDILVNRSDLSRINNVLKNNGFIQGNLDRESLLIKPCGRKEKIDMLINTHQQYQHIRQSKYFPISHYNIQLIDINFTIWEGGNQEDFIKTDYLLKNRILRTTQSGMQYWALKPEYDLIQLCYHVYKDTVYEIKRINHECFIMIHFYDILLLINRYQNEIKWDELLELIVSVNLENQIFFVLSLVWELFGCTQISNLMNDLSKTITVETKKSIHDSLITIWNQ